MVFTNVGVADDPKIAQNSTPFQPHQMLLFALGGRRGGFFLKLRQHFRCWEDQIINKKKKVEFLVSAVIAPEKFEGEKKNW